MVLSDGPCEYSMKKQMKNVKLDISQGQKEAAQGEKLVSINIHLVVCA